MTMSIDHFASSQLAESHFSNAPISVKPEGGGGVGNRVGILTFSEKNYQNPHPRAKNNIIVKGIKIPFSPCCTQEESNKIPHPGAMMSDQNPYPGDIRHSQIPDRSPPPPSGLTLIGA